jgi:membrane-bound metal-dependent hydrolase YbcI (DUF457 family)
MDILSHALWGGITFGRRARRAFLAAAGISLLPDALTEGLFGVLYLLGVGGMPGWGHGHPDITAFPLWAQSLYNLTHSLVVFAAAFLLIWSSARRPVWILGAWGLHILIDIPTHSLELFPTPFLWPVSNVRYDGVGWDNPAILGVNTLLIVGVYCVWLARRYSVSDRWRVWRSCRR